MARKPAPGLATRAKARPETPYQRRIRLYKALHPGATTQEARGKPPSEHVLRKRREIEEIGITTYQRGQVRKFARVQSLRGAYGGDEDAIFETIEAAIREHGYAGFQEIRAFIAAKHRQSLRRGKVITFGGRGVNLGEMQDLADKYGIDIELLRYR